MCDCRTVCMYHITEWRCTKAGGPPPQLRWPSEQTKPKRERTKPKQEVRDDT